MEKKKIWLYLDDVRIPTEGEWEVVRSYDELVSHIKKNGLDAYEVISLDHDLGEGALIEYYTNTKPHYELDYNRIPEKTGMDCARFLISESMNTKITLPTIYVHSSNPIGSANIIGFINNFYRNCKLPETCVKVKIEHTFTQELSEEERHARWNIMKKYK